MTVLELHPCPETRGSLRGPPRRPPTANRTGRLPSPSPFGPRFRRRLPQSHSRARRVVLGTLALVFGLAALPIVSSEGATRVAATTSLAASIDAGLHAATGSMHPWREVVGPAAWRILRAAAAWPSRFGNARRQPSRLARSRSYEYLLNERRLYRSRGRVPDDDGNDAA